MGRIELPSVALRTVDAIESSVKTAAMDWTVPTYPYGRRVYETMVYWETVHALRDQPRFVLDFAKQWQAVTRPRSTQC